MRNWYIKIYGKTIKRLKTVVTFMELHVVPATSGKIFRDQETILPAGRPFKRKVEHVGKWNFMKNWYVIWKNVEKLV